MYPGPLQVSCNFVCHYGSEKKKDENVVKSFLKGKWGKSLTKYKKFIKEDFFAMHNKWGLRKVSFETKSGNENKLHAMEKKLVKEKEGLEKLMICRNRKQKRQLSKTCSALIDT